MFQTVPNLAREIVTKIEIKAFKNITHNETKLSFDDLIISFKMFEKYANVP